jgi:hypothetical protein
MRPWKLDLPAQNSIHNSPSICAGENQRSTIFRSSFEPWFLIPINDVPRHALGACVTAITRPLVEDNRLQTGNLDCLSASGILAAKLIIEADSVIACLCKLSAVPFIGSRREVCFLGPPPPADGIFIRCPAFRAVDCGGHCFVFFVK